MFKLREGKLENFLLILTDVIMISGFVLGLLYLLFLIKNS